MRSLRLNEQRASFTINWQLFPTSDVNGLPSAFWGTDSLQPRYKKLQTADLLWATVSCWGAWENQGEVVWEGSSPARPKDNIIIILLSLPRLEITSTPAKGLCKSLLWEPKITKDTNIGFFLLCLSQKQQECCQGNLKSFYQNRPQLCQGEQPLSK